MAALYVQGACFVEFTNICIPDGGIIGEVVFDNCTSEGRQTMYADGNWMKPDVYIAYNTPGSYGSTMVVHQCTGYGKAFNPCIESWITHLSPNPRPNYTYKPTAEPCP